MRHLSDILSGLDLFTDQQAASEARIIISVPTDLGVFGNRIDIFELGTTVRGTSLLECDNPDVLYASQSSAYPQDIHHDS